MGRGGGGTQVLDGAGRRDRGRKGVNCCPSRPMLETLYRYCCCCPEYLRRDRGYAARGRKVLDEIEMEFVDDPDDLDEGLYDMTSPDKRVALPVTSDNYGPSAVSETRSQPGTDRGAKSALLPEQSNRITY